MNTISILKPQSSLRIRRFARRTRRQQKTKTVPERLSRGARSKTEVSDRDHTNPPPRFLDEFAERSPQQHLAHPLQ
jgi:hypothetical protein